MSLQIFDTLTASLKPLQPLQPPRVRLFVCGPTVYADAHIGHARTYIAFDVITRWIRERGFMLDYIQNITDVDDKIIDRARERGDDALTLARSVEDSYHEDMKRLRVDESGIHYARASDYIPQIINQIERLIARGHAYAADDGSVYFSVPSFPDYGKLSHQRLNQISEAVRIEKDERKRHPADFVLWRGRPNPEKQEPVWDSPWGTGRPGWHIEDTAIAEKKFGHRYDLHGGARDLLFPHHEAEIAQMEAVSGEQPLVNHWLHTGLLNIWGEKMAKSEGNIVSIRTMLLRHAPEAFRLFVLQAHYRSPIEFSEHDLAAAGDGVQRLGEFRDHIRAIAAKGSTAEASAATHDLRERIAEIMDHDFQTPKALAELFSWVRETNERIGRNALTAREAADALSFLSWIDDMFAIIPPPTSASIPDNVRMLVARREEARRRGQWAEADALREQIHKKGFEIRDTDEGPSIKPTK